MNYILVFTLIIVVFFLGFGIGITIPFLLKKYFNLSESNLNQLNKLDSYYSEKIKNLDEEIKKIDSNMNSIKTIEDNLGDLKRKIESMSKSSNLDSNVINEWLYGKNGGDMNESS